MRRVWADPQRPQRKAARVGEQRHRTPGRSGFRETVDTFEHKYVPCTMYTEKVFTVYLRFTLVGVFYLVALPKETGCPLPLF